MTDKYSTSVVQDAEVRIPEPLAATLDELAKQYGASRNQIVVEACETYAAILRSGRRLTRDGGIRQGPEPIAGEIDANPMQGKPVADPGAARSESVGKGARG